MTTQWDNDTPIYVQLYRQVISRILDGYIIEGEALPSVRKVAAQYQINPITISKAYQILQDEDIVEKQRGKGMFVKQGVKESLLKREREQFINNEWPMVLAKINRLKLDLDTLFSTQANNAPTQEAT
ncbi:MAG: GntR family transcriptional regulator [Psychrobium sp.]|nr:GntR family transcriptional regulator [Psychrobium sp.]